MRGGREARPTQGIFSARVSHHYRGSGSLLLLAT